MPSKSRNSETMWARTMTVEEDLEMFRKKMINKMKIRKTEEKVVEKI